MKLICPSPEYFSSKIKFLLNKKFLCNFKKMNETKFNKICHKYEIVLIRFNDFIKYKKKTNIKFILSPTTGIEHIDNKFFLDKKIKILTLRNKINFLRNIRATIEFTIFLILFYLRRGKKNFLINNKVNTINFQEEIYEKNIGIIGYGRIGKKITEILYNFGANLNIYEKNRTKKRIKKKINFLSLNKLLKISDIILIHIPLNKENKNFLNKSKINLLKKNSILINTSRGEVVDEKYILNLVKNKKISYFTDVISRNILFKKRKLLFKLNKNENFFYSNHVAGLTKESVEKTDLFIYKNLQNILLKS